jgi:hypothetical protein
MESDRPNKRPRGTSPTGSRSTTPDVIVSFGPGEHRYNFSKKYLRAQCQVFRDLNDTEFPRTFLIEGGEDDICHMAPWPPCQDDGDVPQKGGPASHGRDFRAFFRILCHNKLRERPSTLIAAAKFVVEGFKVNDEIKGAMSAAILAVSSEHPYDSKTLRIQDRVHLAFHLQDEGQFRTLLTQLITLHLLDNENEGYIFAAGQVPEPLKTLIMKELKTLGENFDRK